MGVTFSSVVEAPRAEVWAWHARRGAIYRLSPPWSPLRVVTEGAWIAILAEKLP